ncbi:MAG: leucine-rich repeat domain-containing protein [Clostridia bacterium]|nr:leucine-rich repeat domain-containing protein [Clostridia bacterium]
MRFKKGRIIFAIFVIIAAILIGLMHTEAANEKTIAFEDENLYIQVKNSLGNKAKSFDNDKKSITVDIGEVTSLRLSGGNIKSIDGLEQFTSLTSLTISNGIATGGGDEDIHTIPTYKLEGLDRLELLNNLNELSLWYCQINNEDLNYIKKLTNLTRLDLSYNEITDVSKIGDLTKITYLNLRGNKIEDINPLNKLINLSWLAIEKNSISDISVVANMKLITDLCFSENNVTDISVLSNLTKLQNLDCQNNNIYDISSLSSLRNLKSVKLSGNHISDFLPLMELPNLVLNDTYLTTIGKQNIDINIKDGDIVKLPPMVKQSFELFDVAEALDCINCSVSEDYATCEVEPGVEAARIRISKGSMRDSIITLRPGDETEPEYKLSETEKKQIKDGKVSEKAIISMPKSAAIVLAVLIFATWIGAIVFVCKKKKK